MCGFSSENAAHRIAVEWDADGQLRRGVFIPRRDTPSLLNAFTGGRISPGIHYRAHFDVCESERQFHIAVDSLDGSVSLAVDCETAADLPSDSVFSSLEDVSRFFESGSLDYSPDRSNGNFDGLELRSFNWSVEPLAIDRIESSFFDDRKAFPAGSVTFDNGLLMRGIDHEWHGRESLCCGVEG